MALDFPASPSNGQIFSSGGISWTFDGEKWKISSSSIEPVFISSSTPTGVAGQIYWDSDESTAYIYYDDGDTAQWVPLVSTAPVSFDTSAIVSGTLPVARGGTGTTSFDAGKIAEGNTEAEVVDTGSDGHFKVTTEGTERLRINNAGTATFTGAVSIDGRYEQTAEAVSALNIDCSTGNFFTKAISSSSTFTFSNVPSSGTAYAFTLEIDVTGTSTTIAWPSSVKFPGNTAPTLTDTKTHLFMFVTNDGGTTFRGSSLVDYTT